MFKKFFAVGAITAGMLLGIGAIDQTGVGVSAAQAHGYGYGGGYGHGHGYGRGYGGPRYRHYGYREFGGYRRVAPRFYGGGGYGRGYGGGYGGGYRAPFPY